MSDGHKAIYDIYLSNFSYRLTFLYECFMDNIFMDNIFMEYGPNHWD